MVFDFLVNFTVGVIIVGMLWLFSKIKIKALKQYNALPEPKRKKVALFAPLIIILPLMYYIISYWVNALSK